MKIIKRLTGILGRSKQPSQTLPGTTKPTLDEMISLLAAQSIGLNEKLTALIEGSINQSQLLDVKLEKIGVGLENQSSLLNEKLSALIEGLINQSQLLDVRLEKVGVGLSNQSSLLNEKLSALIEGSINQSSLLNSKFSALESFLANQSTILSKLLSTMGPPAQRARAKLEAENEKIKIVHASQESLAQQPLATAENTKPSTAEGTTDPLAHSVPDGGCNNILTPMFDLNQPLISVILLCYNQEEFVAEALAGVLAQTYSPLEIVIVDDCSSDGTAEIIAAKLPEHSAHSDVRFIRNPQNMNWWGSCEIALKVTKGSFIVLSCGDDVMLPDMVSDMANVWRTERVSLVTTNATYIDEYSKPLGRNACECDVLADDSFETLARDGANACCFGAAIGFEREIYSTFGLPPPHLGAFDIMLPFYAYLLRGARFVRKPLLRYRVHERNTSLALIAEKSTGLEQLLAKERIFRGHLAHAVLMKEEFDRLSKWMPTRYLELERGIGPLLTIQALETAKKLVRTQIELHKLRSNQAS